MSLIKPSGTEQRERILSFMKSKGPSLPVQVARTISVTPLFAGAFLSELYGDKKIKISHMRVGSSPLYYLEGQEAMLENFIEHLNVREKEAFFYLKGKGILEDDALTPIIRVALRAIVDFAIPIKIKLKDNIKTFWRYFLLPEGEAMNKIEGIINPESLKKDIKQPVVEVVVKEELKKEDGRISDKKELEKIVPTVEEVVKTKTKRKEGVKKEKAKVKLQDSAFSNKVKDYLIGKDIELLQVILEKNKEFIAKVRVDILFGKQEFLLIAKDKKKIEDNDLIVALHRAGNLKMPSLFISNGSLDKNAEVYLKEWNGLLKFEKVKF